MVDATMEAVDSVLNTLPQLWERLRGRLRAAAIERFGITLEQFHALRHIRRGCSSVSELADRKLTSKAAVSQSVEALVRKGLVTRSRDQVDRRKVRLELTPYAKEVLEANAAANRAFMTERMATLTEEEIILIQGAMTALQRLFLPEERGDLGGGA